MRSNLSKVLGLGITLCLGLTWACVKVDVSVLSQNESRTEPSFPPLPPSISIDDLKKLQSETSCTPGFLDVTKEQQQTAAWCWAASARMVMDYHNKNEEPPRPTALQCDIVRNVFSPQIGGVNCCENEVARDFIDAPSACVQGGWPYWVLHKYQFDYQWLAGALDDWEALTGEICSIGPFISVIEWSGGGRHAFIVKGYAPSPQKIVQVYDPILNDPQDMTFDEFLGDSPRQQHGFHKFSHYQNFVQIQPKTKVHP